MKNVLGIGDAMRHLGIHLEFRKLEAIRIEKRLGGTA